MEDFTVPQLIDCMLEGKPIPEHEIRRLVYRDFPADPSLVYVEEEEDEARRWYSRVEVIFKVNNERFFRVWYDRGLTECQDNEYEEQIAVEVEPKTRTVVETYWEEKHE